MNIFNLCVFQESSSILPHELKRKLYGLSEMILWYSDLLRFKLYPVQIILCPRRMEEGMDYWKVLLLNPPRRQVNQGVTNETLRIQRHVRRDAVSVQAVCQARAVRICPVVILPSWNDGHAIRHESACIGIFADHLVVSEYLEHDPLHTGSQARAQDYVRP